jgi:hypothetical protein
LLLLLLFFKMISLSLLHFVCCGHRTRHDIDL